MDIPRRETWNEDRFAREREALLQEAVFGAPLRRAAARARLAQQAHTAAELRDLEVQLARAHGALGAVPEWSTAQEQQLVERVLEATTRRAPERAPRSSW